MFAIAAADAAAATIAVTSTGDTVRQRRGLLAARGCQRGEHEHPVRRVAGECPAGSAGPAADTVSVGAGSFNLAGAD